MAVAFLAVCGVTAPADAQQATIGPTSLQLRVGAFFATPLIRDAVSSASLDATIPGERSDEITIQQQVSPIATLAVRVPLRATTQLEVSGSVARSGIRGDDGLEAWDVTTATVGNFIVGLGYLYRSVTLHAGVGATRFFDNDSALLNEGNTMKPLFEAGAATGFNLAGRALEIDLRAQSHPFATPVRENGGADGYVTRVVLQIGTMLWAGSR